MGPSCRIVVVGASAGGVQSLQAFVAGLPADLNAAVFVVLHIAPYTTSHLAHILDRCGPLPAVHAQDGEEIRPGRIYVASPDHHLLVEGERVGVKHGPKENRFRPSVDALFRSAAYMHKERVIGIVLSGLLNDGTSGLWSVKRFGGTTVVQDPREAAVDSMPLSALAEVEIDHVLPAAEIGSLVGKLVQEPPRAAVQVPQDVAERMEVEVAVAGSANGFQRGILRHGETTALTCPECHGALSRITEGRLTRFRCHTGHGFTADALISGITHTAEEALWNATRALEEGVMLLDEMAHQLEEQGRSDEAAQLKRRAQVMQQRASAVQELATTQETVNADAHRGKAEVQTA
jgi:two-component system, chemotaxis family, protein-glutamate methylesterase/glutaminase